jgi:hypothetical protein
MKIFSLFSLCVLYCKYSRGNCRCVFQIVFLFLLCPVLQLLAQSYVQTINNQQIAFLEGSPYEIGYQHGILLTDQIQHNVQRIVDGYLTVLHDPAEAQALLDTAAQSRIPNALTEELQGLADGSGIPLNKIMLLNLLSRLFSCSGITAAGAATIQGEPYFVRVCEAHLGEDCQDSSVLFIVKPKLGNAFASIGYAGLVGVLAGINENKICVAEINAQRQKDADPLPMVFVLREILENASTLPEANRILKNGHMLTRYTYLMADGTSSASLAAYEANGLLEYVQPGSSYGILFPENPGQKLDWEFSIFMDAYFMYHTPYQIAIFTDTSKKECVASFFTFPEEMILISTPQRYAQLIEKLDNLYGKIGIPELKALIEMPSSIPVERHNALFAPASLELWLSRPRLKDALQDQPYNYYDLKVLLKGN